MQILVTWTIALMSLIIWSLSLQAAEPALSKSDACVAAILKFADGQKTEPLPSIKTLQLRGTEIQNYFNQTDETRNLILASGKSTLLNQVLLASAGAAVAGIAAMTHHDVLAMTSTLFAAVMTQPLLIAGIEKLTQRDVSQDFDLIRSELKGVPEKAKWTYEGKSYDVSGTIVGHEESDTVKVDIDYILYYEPSAKDPKTLEPVLDIFLRINGTSLELNSKPNSYLLSLGNLS